MKYNNFNDMTRLTDALNIQKLNLRIYLFHGFPFVHKTF